MEKIKKDFLHAVVSIEFYEQGDLIGYPSTQKKKYLIVAEVIVTKEWKLSIILKLFSIRNRFVTKKQWCLLVPFFDAL